MQENAFGTSHWVPTPCVALNQICRGWKFAYFADKYTGVEHRVPTPCVTPRQFSTYIILFASFHAYLVLECLNRLEYLWMTYDQILKSFLSLFISNHHLCIKLYTIHTKKNYSHKVIKINICTRKEHQVWGKIYLYVVLDADHYCLRIFYVREYGDDEVGSNYGYDGVTMVISSIGNFWPYSKNQSI